MEMATGQKLYELIEKLFPICRSITGPGVRETLKIISNYVPIEIKEINSGSKVFDWEIPKEWAVNDAYIMNSSGDRIVDFKKNNLHLLNYSIPLNCKLSLNDLKKHLFTIPEKPNLIPYRTSYYKENWGFCISHNQFESLKDEEYNVVIDSKLENGVLNWGEFLIPGKSEQEVLLTTHICHPSLCNDNLSGISVLTFLAKKMLSEKLKYSYRVLFIPGTIGSIAWLAQNENIISKIKYGLVMTLLGDQGAFTYKKSRQANSIIDRTIKHLFNQNGMQNEIRDFIPFGYDERQFCSPGINLPVGCLMRTPYGEFPEYHTSADNLEFIKQESLLESYNFILKIIQTIESEKKYLNQNPKCEPQLGKRGIYSSISGDNNRSKELALLWVLNYSDGNYSIRDIAEKSGIELSVLESAAEILMINNLLKEV